MLLLLLLLLVKIKYDKIGRIKSTLVSIIIPCLNEERAIRGREKSES
ncbi:hypothetical protein HY030_02250 [Candidatus Gottesmanbacteria bacterium]|nr:hypothetical protein [Candidatus Gottesmanbacteria bacterium]